MKKTERCYYFFVILSILIGFLLLILFYRQHQGFEYPTQENLRIFLQNLKYLLLIGLIISTSLCVTIKCIIRDLEWRLANMEMQIEKIKNDGSDLR